MLADLPSLLYTVISTFLHPCFLPVHHWRIAWQRWQWCYGLFDAFAMMGLFPNPGQDIYSSVLRRR